MSNFVNLLDIIYPVGSVYITFSDVSPVDSVGGSWEKIDGKFLQSSSEINALNSTGGFSGNIGFSYVYGAWYGTIVPTWNADIDISLCNFVNVSNSKKYTDNIIKLADATKVNSQYNHSCNANIASSVGSVSHPIMVTKELYWDSRPAYITCNMYRRTA